MSRIFFFFFTFFLSTVSIAQKHDNNWLMGGTCAFSEAHLLAKLDFVKDDTASELLPHTSFFFNDTNASISDEVGSLLFYTNGNDIFNWKHELMENGANMADLGECNEQNLQQGAIAVPFPEHINQYVLITINEEFILHNDDIQVFEKVYFNVVDMNANEGEGSLVIRQDLIIEDTLNTGQGMLCQHANGRDWWLLMFEFDSNRYYRFLIDPSGVSFLGQGLTEVWVPAGRSQAVYSPDGEFLVHFNTVNKAEGTFIDILKFDRCMGWLSDQMQIRFNDMTDFGSGGVAFSPNSRFLYVPNEMRVYQYDMWAEDIEASRVTVAEYDGFIEDNFWRTTFHMAQLAPNDKIYITTPTDGHYLHVIHNPNEKGLACNLEQHALEWPTWKHISIPNFPHYRMGPLEGSLCDTLGVSTSPFANFSIEDIGSLLSYQFHDRSTTNVEEWFWDFGDGSSSVEQNPLKEYSQFGSYNICLTVSNEVGSDTECQNLCILPDASSTSFISASSLEIDCSDSQSAITLSSRLMELDFYEVDSWIAKWEGPDGFLEENSAEIEVYQQGTYTLTLTDANSTCTITDTVIITENNADITFELDPPLATLPCNETVDVQIQLDNIGCHIVHVMDEDNNQMIGSSTTVFTFAKEGTYLFSVTDCAGGCETTKELIVELDTITAVWEVNIMENTVSFIPIQDDESILSHIWEFGDGNFSFEATPSHTYDAVGTYEVEHTAFSLCENRSYTSEIIIVEGVFIAPSAEFKYANSDSLFGFTFEDQTINDPSDWLWDFGDGNTSTEQNPSHEYSKFGSYEVCLTATNIVGSDTYCETICVLLDELEASLIQATNTVLDCNNIEEGIVLSTSIVLSDFFNSEDWFFAWTYPMGEMEVMEEIVIYEAGTYIFELIETSSNCSIVADIVIIENLDTPIFSITTSADTITCGAFFELYISSDSICYEAMVFENELPILSSNQDTIILEGSGNYTVELVDCVSGCGSRQEFSIQNESINASWTSEEMGATFTFIPGQMANVDHFWDFGDGMTSEEQNPMHIYASSGTYEVTHVVSNACGADTLVQFIEVIITSSHSLAESGLEVFPNPASETLNIISEEKEIREVRLYSSLGQLIVDKKQQTVTVQFSVGGLAPGVYWLHVELSDGKSFLEKVLVLH